MCTLIRRIDVYDMLICKVTIKYSKKTQIIIIKNK